MPLTEKASNSSLKGRGGERSRLRDISATVITDDLDAERFPPNFGEVVKGIYRSSFPQPWHFPVLTQLNLKMIVTLVEGEYTQDYQVFLKENGIEHRRILVQANKDPTIRTPDHIVNYILETLLNKVNHPMLIHCNKGRHRTGCIIGCFRKLQGWDMAATIEEYLDFSWPKSRSLDERFIGLFDESRLGPLALSVGAPSWLAGRRLAPLREDSGQDENIPKRRLHSSVSDYKKTS